MAVIKCKMCGGSLQITENSSVCECEYCGTRQTVPKVDDERKLTLFGRAGKLLRACEFDKAAGVFESIVADFPEEAEAYWGLVLCKYGIEYVDDPATGKKIPTCHRSSFDSVEDDANFEQACENADALARRVYRDEARQIEGLRKKILEVSGREEPYDVFISYKETDEEGERTPDSVIAQDIYKALTKEGYRVFFSRISLEGKLGVEYEPYIFAALNSARVLLAVGTDYEYYDAVWVKNEWSRFLKLIASGQPKTLIPVYKDMDPYDMPKELRGLAAQNMGKLGAMQDLLHGIEKIVGKKGEEPAQPRQVIQQTVVQGGANLDALLKRGFMSLEDAQWDKATELFDKVLNDDPENAQAYLGLAMAEARTGDRDAYAAAYTTADSKLRGSRNAARARQFDPELDTWFAKLDKQGRSADEQARIAREKKAEEERMAREKEEEEEKERLKKQAILTRLAPIRQRNAPAAGMLAVGGSHVVGLWSYGRVLAMGDNDAGQCDVSGWRNIVAVSAGSKHTVGLRSDGTVVAAGADNGGQCQVSDWKDVVAVSAMESHTVGLRSDGTVVAVGKNDYGQRDVSDWTDIVAVSSGYSHTVGLRRDGTVISTKYIGDQKYDYGQCKLSDWRNIVAVSAGYYHTVGLRIDGTVVAVGNNAYGQCNVNDWTDIVSVSTGVYHTVGLRTDGTVVSTKIIGDQKYNYSQYEVSNWRDIVAVFAGTGRTVGLRSDGAVLDSFDQSSVKAWKLFGSIDTIEAERKAALEKAEAEHNAAAERAAATRKAKIAALNREKAELQEELASLRGLFTGKRRKEIEARLAQIEAELKKPG